MEWSLYLAEIKETKKIDNIFIVCYTSLVKMFVYHTSKRRLSFTSVDVVLRYYSLHLQHCANRNT